MADAEREGVLPALHVAEPPPGARAVVIADEDLGLGVVDQRERNLGAEVEQQASIPIRALTIGFAAGHGRGHRAQPPAHRRAHANEVEELEIHAADKAGPELSGIDRPEAAGEPDLEPDAHAVRRAAEALV